VTGQGSGDPAGSQGTGGRLPAGPRSDEELVGGEVCWLGSLCPECGAMPEGAGAEDPAVPCWRCGAVRARTVQGGDAGAGA
jgi:hypothetical protein